MCLYCMIKRKRIYYVPGLISLLILPIILLHYSNEPKKQVVLRFYLASDDMDTNSPVIKYSKWALLSEIQKKKITPFYLDDDQKQNLQTLKSIQSEAARLRSAYDTMHVLQVRLSDKSTFGEFVSLLNIMYMNRQKRYGLVDNNFYIFGDRPPVEKKNTIEQINL